MGEGEQEPNWLLAGRVMLEFRLYYTVKTLKRIEESTRTISSI